MTLDALAVEAFSRGRLSSDDEETQRQLDAALLAAQRYCGWHVSPVLSDAVVTLDGTSDYLVVLPTLMMTELVSVSEDGIAIDLADLHWSQRGLIAKRSGVRWSGLFSSIVVTMSHGFADAPDFEGAILGSIERGAFSSERTVRAIGPFQYNDDASIATGLFTESERAVLDRYALEKRP